MLRGGHASPKCRRRVDGSIIIMSRDKRLGHFSTTVLRCVQHPSVDCTLHAPKTAVEKSPERWSQIMSQRFFIRRQLNKSNQHLCTPNERTSVYICGRRIVKAAASLMYTRPLCARAVFTLRRYVCNMLAFRTYKPLSLYLVCFDFAPLFASLPPYYVALLFKLVREKARRP